MKMIDADTVNIISGIISILMLICISITIENMFLFGLGTFLIVSIYLLISAILIMGDSNEQRKDRGVKGKIKD